MIDINLYEKDLDYQNAYKQSLKHRGEDESILEPLVELNQKRKNLIFRIEQLIVERKNIEKQMLSIKDSSEKKNILMKPKPKESKWNNLKVS